MAFDMHFGRASHESIGPHEEFLFELAQIDGERFPELLSIWTAFYDGPRISAVQSGRLVHELIELLAANGGLTNKALAATAMRLLSFFSMAHRAGLEVRCVSD